MNSKIVSAGFPVSLVLALALPTAAQARDAECDAAIAFVETQAEAGVDVATYNREEIQWLLKHQSRPANCAPVPADLKARQRGEYPLPKHHRRMNCHIAMDYLLDENERGIAVSAADKQWAMAYVNAVEAGELCDSVPRGIALRATGHSIAGSDMKQFLASAMDDAGDGDATLEIAMAYFLGTLVGKDIEKGYSYLVSASKLGNAWADLELANLYRAGKVENEPKSKAIDFAQKAAETGNPIAYLLLADIYYTGDVVKKDQDKAAEYYLKAAERGELMGTIIAAKLLFESKDSKLRKRGYNLALTAANAGDTNAMALLASMILQQKDLVKNEGEIWHWINAARDGGNPTAIAFLNEKKGELEKLFVKAKYVPPKRECEEILVCDVYYSNNGRSKTKYCAPRRNWITCDYSL